MRLLASALPALALSLAPASAQLFEQIDLVTHPGAGNGGWDVSEASPGPTGYSCWEALDTWIADDFTVSDPNGWDVDVLRLWCYVPNVGGFPVFNDAYWNLWDGPPGDPGSSVLVQGPLFGNFQQASLGFLYRIPSGGDFMDTTNKCYELEIALGVTLGPGTYWLEMQVSDAFFTQEMWAPTNPGTAGNGRATSDGWATFTDAGEGFAFALDGSVVSGIPETPRSDGFESYPLGTSIEGTCAWEGWDGVVHHHSTVTNAFAFDGAQSLALEGGADTVQIFHYTQGRVTASAQVYVPSGSTGSQFFILMDTYTHGGPYEWGGQAEFHQSTGLVEFDCGGSSAFTAPIVYDAWTELRFEIDLDADFAQAFYGGNAVGTWTWTDGTDGFSNNDQATFEALDLYATGTGTVYLDAVQVVRNEGATVYCDHAQNAANVADLGIDTLDAGAPSIRLCLSNAPPGQFCYLLVGDGNATISAPPGSVGDLCIGGGACLGRYDSDVRKISACGTAITDVLSAASTPCGGTVVIAPGTTWYWQYWHRQAQGQPSSFSAALATTFQ